MIGEMMMPDGFGYADVFRGGPPTHGASDPFRLRHPAMEKGRRAKIFAPFDALMGFDERISAQETEYEFRQELSEEREEELERRMCILHRLTLNGRLARENAVPVIVTWFLPCQDRNHPAFGQRGKYVTRSGVCGGIREGRMLVDGVKIPLRDISDITTSRTEDGRNLFEPWE